ncbi:Aste57867_493 [Aphanomyces stellatus]|uniref:Aste57867_493 protein n=1 Tax=Aphanomyces stellatus TaxID=120398 RepID=A0A485K5X5_9STRA|nr:hypothetical protein As57867_000492 [Aphanomyces stellatus]VFT77718.1 Aste57867_493 [Aphanomyces stellatus]
MCPIDTPVPTTISDGQLILFSRALSCATTINDDVSLMLLTSLLALVAWGAFEPSRVYANFSPCPTLVDACTLATIDPVSCSLAFHAAQKLGLTFMPRRLVVDCMRWRK